MSAPEAPLPRPDAAPLERLRALARLAGPIALANLATVLTSIVDTLMVGQLGEGALAALGACGALQLVVALVFTSLIVGVQVLTARRVGAGDHAALPDILGTALRLGLVLAAVGGLTGLLLPSLLLPLWVEDPAIAAEGARYLEWRWGLGIPALTLLFVLKGFLFGLGKSRAEAIIGPASAVLNVGLNAVLIHGLGPAPRMGTAGAGLASALSVHAALLAYALFIARPSFRARAHLRTWGRFDRESFRHLVRLSLPRATQSLAFAVSALPFFALVGRLLGSTALAISLVLWRLFGLCVLISISIGTATATHVSQALGAGDRAAARAWTNASLALAWGVVGLLSVAALLLGDPLLAAFALGEDAIARARPAFLLLMSLQVIDATGIVLSRALTGAGEAAFCARTEILVAAFACVPATWLGIRLMADSDPLLGAWAGWAAYMLAWMLAMSLRWRSGRWGRRTF